MHLVIHAGCHKTATSAFQALCQYAQSEFQTHGLLYPLADGQRQHSYLAHDIQRGDFSSFEALLVQAAGASPNTVLLSGEDFENCLVDLDLAQRIEKAAFAHHVTKLTWLFVKRDMQSYVNSLYSELSKHQIVVRYKTIAARAKQAGYFSVSTERYAHMFVLDIDRFVLRFSDTVRGNVEVIAFEEFAVGVPGETILKRFIAPNDLANILKNYAPKRDAANSRLSRLAVEKNYAQSFFGVRLRDQNLLRRMLAWMIVPPSALLRLWLTKISSK